MAMSSVATRLSEITREIAEHADSSDRDPSEVTLVAVTKGVSTEYIRAAIDAGHLDFGESRAQEAMVKAEEFPEVRWHFLGRIQRNKVKLLDFAHLIHSLDRPELISEFDIRSDRQKDCLMQLNLSGEATKAGVSEEEASHFAEAVQQSLGTITLSGLMTIPPPSPDAEASRPYFRRLRELRDALSERFPRIHHLSMGMSQDYGVAIQEGATLVRIGTAIFGPRQV